MELAVSDSSHCLFAYIFRIIALSNAILYENVCLYVLASALLLLSLLLLKPRI